MFRIGNLFRLLILSTGRRMFALQQVRKLATQRGDTAIAERAQLALTHDRKTRVLDLAWSGMQNGGRSSPRTRTADARLDSSLSGLRGGAVSLTQGALPDDPLIAKVEDFLDRVFPAGVGAITQLPYVDELSAAETIVELLQGELAPVVVELGLTVQAERVITRTTEYRTVQEAEELPLQFAKVSAARTAGHTYAMGVVALIVATYHEPDNQEHQAAREQLLAPILAQDEAIRAYRRARRRVVDIDPDSGELDPAPLPGSEQDDSLSPDYNPLNQDDSPLDADTSEPAA